MSELEHLLHHSDWLRKLAARLVGDPAAAEDLVQDTWLAALEGERDPRRPAKPWLIGVARRLASLRARSGARRSEREELAARREARPDAADALARIETERRLAAAVLRLPEPARSVLVLRYYEELSTAEVAARLGIPEATVRSRTKRALERLRAELDREGGGRREWLGAVGMLVDRSGPGAVGGGAATLAAGGALVSVTKLVVVAAAVVAFVGVAWFVGREQVPTAGEAAAVAPAPELAEPRAAGQEPARAPEPEGERRVAEQAVTGAREAAVDAPELARVSVVEADGRPAAERRVALVGQVEVETATTDDAGVVSLRSRAGDAWLVVERPGAPPHVAALALDAGDQQVTLPAGRRLAGRAVFSDGEPAAGLSLELAGDRSPLEPVADHAEQLAELGFEAEVEFVTDPAGGFAFDALPADWSGELRPPVGYRLGGGEASPRKRAARRVDAPTTGLQLVLERLPRVHGRVVEAGGEVGVPGARVFLHVNRSSSGTTYYLTTDDDGRFVGYFTEPGLVEVAARAQAPDGRRASAGPDAERELLLDARGIDLGDLELAPPGPTVELRVRDRDGAPIAGAEAGPADAAPSDADGSIVATLPSAEVEELFVSAEGFLPVQVALPSAAPAAPLEVVLERGAGLDLVVTDGDDRPASGLQVQLGGRTPFFAQELFIPTGPDGARFLMSSRDDDGWTWTTAALDERGGLELSELVPGVGFELRVLDCTGEPCAAERVEPIEAGERRELRLAIDADAPPLAGRVLDEQRRPVSDVRLRIADGPARARTDSLGRFRFAAVGARELELVATKRGYVRRAAAVPPARVELELTLGRARDLELVVVDEAGAPLAVDAALVRATDGGPDWRAEPRDDGRLVLEDVPTGELSVELELGERRELRSLAAGVGRSQLVVAR